MNRMVVALILWRTWWHAKRYVHTDTMPVAPWWDRFTPWVPVPRWARQHPLLACVMRLPLAQRYAILQLVYPQQLGAQRNPRMLLFALRACARVLFAGAHVRVSTALCAQYEPILASGHVSTMRQHLRRCGACQHRARTMASTRQAVIATITTMQLPQHMPATAIPRWSALVVSIAVIGAAFVIPIMWPQYRVYAIAPYDARQLVQHAEATLYQPAEMSEGMQEYQQYEIFWRFADGSVTLLNAELWYSQHPIQYRAQLTHYAGGSPFELDIATQAFRFYGVSAAYAPDIWPPQTEAMRVIMPMGSLKTAEALRWRTRQGAWAVPWLVLHQIQHATEAPTVVGTTFALDGTPLVRMQHGSWWIDVDPASGRLAALWYLHHDTAQLRWRMRWHAQTARENDRVFVVTQRQYGDVSDRALPALHPALPLIPADAGAVPRADTVDFVQDNLRCRATLIDTFIARCVDTRTARETVYTVGRIP